MNNIDLNPRFFLTTRVATLEQIGITQTSDIIPYSFTSCCGRENKHTKLKKVKNILNQSIEESKKEVENPQKVECLLENIKYFNQNLKLYNQAWNIRLFFATISLVPTEAVERKIVEINSPKGEVKTASELVKSLPEEKGGIIGSILKIYECAYCLDPMDTAVFVEPCGHEFHEKCISEIMKTKSTCPMCNTTMNGYKLALTSRAAVETLLRLSQSNE